jgi:hypothetical protein
MNNVAKPGVKGGRHHQAKDGVTPAASRHWKAPEISGERGKKTSFFWKNEPNYIA